MIWLLALVLGLLCGLVLGGRLENFTRLSFHWPFVVVLALLIRLAVLLSPLNRVQGAQWLYAGSLAVIVLWGLWHIRRLPGVWLVSLGGAMNLAVIAANGGRMPVEASLAGPLLRQGPLGQYAVMGSGTVLHWLGDWIAVPPFQEAYSPGDLVIALGLAAICVMVLLSHHAEPYVVRPKSRPEGSPPGRIVNGPP